MNPQEEGTPRLLWTPGAAAAAARICRGGLRALRAPRHLRRGSWVRLKLHEAGLDSAGHVRDQKVAVRRGGGGKRGALFAPSGIREDVRTDLFIGELDPLLEVRGLRTKCPVPQFVPSVNA